MKLSFAVLLLSLFPSVALAQEPAPLDLGAVDPAMLEDFYHPWIISNQDGSRTCRVVLKREETIGGNEIDVDPACASVFPVMGEIAAWRLVENWGIVLADATRRTRLLFTTPDAIYIADDEVDGIYSIALED